MGIEIQVNNLEDMCDLMCNNYIRAEDEDKEEKMENDPDKYTLLEEEE